MIDHLPGAIDPGEIIQMAHFGKSDSWGTPMAADYPALVTAFLSLLHERDIPFVVVGGIALLQHVSGRNTDDIDLIISAPRLSHIPELFVRDRNEMFAYGHFSDLRVGVLFAEHALFGKIAQDFTIPMNYGIGVLPTATVDGLLLLKLFALPSLYRQFDFDRIAIYEADIMQLLRHSTNPNSFFIDVLAHHISDSDCKELEITLGETRARLARVRG